MNCVNNKARQHRSYFSNTSPERDSTATKALQSRILPTSVHRTYGSLSSVYQPLILMKAIPSQRLVCFLAPNKGLHHSICWMLISLVLSSFTTAPQHLFLRNHSQTSSSLKRSYRSSRQSCRTAAGRGCGRTLLALLHCPARQLHCDLFPALLLAFKRKQGGAQSLILLWGPILVINDAIELRTPLPDGIYAASRKIVEDLVRVLALPSQLLDRRILFS